MLDDIVKDNLHAVLESITLILSKLKLVRFAHNWNVGIMECWNTGFWEIEGMVCWENHLDKTCNK